MASAVEKSLAEGEFDKFVNASEFASQLSEQLLAICHDKHLRVRAGNHAVRQERDPAIVRQTIMVL